MSKLPFYIGKGKGKRAFDHLVQTKESTENIHKYYKIQSILRKDLAPVVEIVQTES